MLNVIGYVRKHSIPYFGICYGMQLAVLEYAQSVLKLKDASTEEIDPKAADLVVGIMEGQRENIAAANMGGTMRLGVYEANLQKGSLAAAAYKATSVIERHRHRYEINPAYVEQLRTVGMNFSGVSPDGQIGRAHV